MSDRIVTWILLSRVGYSFMGVHTSDRALLHPDKALEKEAVIV